jgi:hypothetical protein
MVEAPAPGAATGLTPKPAVVPEGRPEAESVMEELNPPLTAVLISEEPDVVRATLSEVGDAETVKSGAGVTVRVTVVLLVTPPPVPVTVMG